MKICGIYRIRNNVTGDAYIGSAKNVQLRWKTHKNSLNKGEHHSFVLQEAWNFHGGENFIFEILNECPKSELLLREAYYIKIYNSKYNVKRERNRAKETELPEELFEILRPTLINLQISQVVNRKVVEMLDKRSGEVLEVFGSMSEACAYLGRTKDFVSNISRVCSGKSNSAFGYKWRHVEDEKETVS